MKTHYAAQELAGLPGMPQTIKGILQAVKRESWPSQKRAGRGGGREYPIAALPAETRAYLDNQHLDTQAAATLPAVHKPAQAPAIVEPAPLPALTSLTGRQVAVMDARIWFIRLIEQRAAGQSITGVMAAISGRVAAGEMPYAAMAATANDRKRKERGVKARSIMRWWSVWLASGRKPEALAPNDGEVRRVRKETELVAFARDFGTHRDSGLLPATVPAWLPYFLINYRKPQHPSIADAMRDMRRTMPAGIAMPSYSQVSRIAQKIPAVYIEKGRKTGAELKAIMGFNRRVWSDYHPFTVGQVDGHSFKAYVAHPVTGAHFHPEVCAIIDMTTKILTGYSAGLAESSRTVADAFRHSCTVSETKPVGGIFSIIEADLGAGNKARVNADRDIGLFARLGTQLSFPEVAGNPQGHGGIERSNQSIWIRAAKELPTYTGKDMDRVTRKRIYTRLERDLKATEKAGELGKVEKTSKLLLSWREFLAALEIWVAEYNNTPHSALPKITDPITGRRRHRTPHEELAHRINQGWDPKSVQLEGDMLGHLYMPHERIKITRCEFRLHGNLYHAYDLQTHHDEEMIAAYDIHDANHVWVLNQGEQLICKATWNGNNIHGVPTSKMEQADFERMDRRIKLKERQLDMIKSEAQQAVIVEPLTPEQTAIQERLKIELKAKPETNVRQMEVESSRMKYKRMKALREELTAGGIISEEDYKALVMYEQTPEFRALKGMEEEFGKAFK